MSLTNSYLVFCFLFFFYFLHLAHKAALEKVDGHMVTVTNTALGHSTGVGLWYRGLGLLPDGCYVHAGQHDQVAEGRVCHHVVHQDLGGLLPVHPQLRPLEDLWESRGGGDVSEGSRGPGDPQAQALPSPAGCGMFLKGLVHRGGQVKTAAPRSQRNRLVAWQCTSTKPEESQNC